MTRDVGGLLAAAVAAFERKLKLPRAKVRLRDRRGRVHPVRSDRRSLQTTWLESCLRQALGHAQQGVTEQHYLPRHDPVMQNWVDRIALRQGGQLARLGPLPSGALLAPGPRLLR